MRPALGAFSGRARRVCASRPRASRARPTGPTLTPPPHLTVRQCLPPRSDGSALPRRWPQVHSVQTAAFGTDHNQTDTYNELNPPSGKLDYLAQRRSQTMAAADPNAVWLMQGWMFYTRPGKTPWWTPPRIAAYLSGTRGDLFGSQHPVWNSTASFGGHPFIYCAAQFWRDERHCRDMPRLEEGFNTAQPPLTTRASLGSADNGGIVDGVSCLSARFSWDGSRRG